MGYSLIHDCLWPGLFLSDSYEEAERYCKLANVYDPGNRDSETNMANIAKSRANGKKWWEVQFGMAQNFYSRSTPSQDAGKHAAAMSILHCIISRACDEKKGYEIENELFDILDDYIVLSIHLYFEIFAKFRSELQKRNQIVLHANGADEQFIVYEEPLKYWLKLMPDCPEKWKEQFEKHYHTLIKSPFPICPDVMEKIGEYFSAAQMVKKKCERCGYENSELSPFCIKCRYKFSTITSHPTMNESMLKEMTDSIENEHSSFSCPFCGHHNSGKDSFCAKCSKPLTNIPQRKIPQGCLILMMLVLLGAAGYYWYSAIVTKSHVISSWVLAIIWSLLLLNSIIVAIKNKK